MRIFPVLLCLFLLAAPALAAESAQKPGSQDSGTSPSPIPLICPLGAPPMTVSLAQDVYQGRAGEPVDVAIVVDPPDLPPGFYMTSIVRMLKAPEGVPNAERETDILPGVPVTRITPTHPGTYVFAIQVNLVAKSSCAGAKAASLTVLTVTLEISD